MKRVATAMAKSFGMSQREEDRQRPDTQNQKSDSDSKSLNCEAA
jgi:hypothetical protein